jgi:hypothetical protein
MGAPGLTGIRAWHSVSLMSALFSATVVVTFGPEHNGTQTRVGYTMNFADQVRKCVAFIGCPIVGAGFKIVGSVFFFGKSKGQYTDPTFLVTADHVIADMKKLGCKHAAVRFNTKGGITKYLVTDINDWYTHPTDASVDVAVLECGLPKGADHLVMPSSAMIKTSEMSDVPLGSDVMVAGLFSHHSGTDRNIPIVRSGSLACVTEEKVPLIGYGEAEAYLIEMHSTGGISGSPVLVRAPPPNFEPGVMVGGLPYHFIGLMHGHFEKPLKAKGKMQFDNDEVLAMINTGIAIVVPAEKIDEVIDLYIANPKKRGPISHEILLEKYAPDVD